MGERERFEILGPVRCYIGTREVTIAQDRERALLATLLLHAGKPVPTVTLVDSVWNEQPPRSARGQLHSSVWRLRKLLSDAGASRQIVVTEPVGYRIEIEPDDLDLYKFRRLRDDARAAAAAGRHAAANDLYRAALALWRGQALAGIESALVRDDSVALDEEHAQALEECIEIELERGKGSELVPELTTSARQHPYRERLHGALMLALYRAGRQADALAAYQRADQLVRHNLGIEPGRELQNLHRAILNREPKLNRPRQQLTRGSKDTRFTPEIPRMLPPDVRGFVGRESEIESLRGYLTRRAIDAVRVVAIDGRAGIGKTVLSTHIAHLTRDSFPDGQLFADLRGLDSDEPATPFEVLGRFLRALGIGGHTLPATLDERVDLYRGLLAHRKILVILDNAATTNQVLPLLPGGTGCATLVNSRIRLGHAVGAETVSLGVFEGPQSTELLARIAGSRRIQSDVDAVADLTRLCGNLPLAIRIAGAKLAAKPHWSIRKLADRLGDERQRLDRLTYGHLDVRSSIGLSYTGLTPEAQRLLRRLGDVEIPAVNVWSAAALLDMAVGETEEILEQLYDAQLVDIAGEDSTGHARYRLHDLVKLLARERAASDEPAGERDACQRRTAGAWLTMAEVVHRGVFGGDYMTISSPVPRRAIETHLIEEVAADPLHWFDHERHSIVAMVRQSAKDKNIPQCWGIAAITSPLFQMRYYYDDWTAILETAHSATQLAGDDLGRAAILYRIGGIYADRQDYTTAMECLSDAAALFESAGHRYGHAISTAHAAQVDRLRGNLEAALRGYKQALPILAGDYGGEAYTLRGIGQVYMTLGDDSRADSFLAQALRVARLHSSRRSEAQTLFWQGMLRLRRGTYELARPLFTEALTLTQSLGDRPGEAQALRGLGLCHKGQGDIEAAVAALSAALRLVRQPRATSIETSIRRELAEVSGVLS